MFKLLSLILSLAFIGNQLFRVHIGNVGVSLLDISVCAISAGWFVYNISSLRQIFWDDLVGRSWVFFVTAALFSLTVNIGTLSSSSFAVALLYLLRWVCYSSLYFAIKHSSKEKKETIYHNLVIVGSVMVVIGYIQYFFYSNLQNLFYLGWDDHMYRLFSTFLDPNFAAGFFVLFIVLLVTQIIRTKKTIHTRIDLIKRIVLILAIGTTFLTFSRSGLVMFVISLFILFILENKKKLLLTVFLGTGVFILIASQFFYLENINLLRTASSNERVKSAQNAIRIFQTSPLFGVGFNAYKPAQVRMGFRNENPPIVSNADSGTDNSFLFLLATTGIVGTGFFLNFLYRLITSFSYNHAGKMPLMTVVSVVSFIGIVIDSMFINSLFYPSIMLWLWLIWGITDYK